MIFLTPEIKFPHGTFSKKGRRGSGMRLHHSEYKKYSYQNESYYYKKKYYTSAYDGTIEYEKITSTTFKKAIGRGNTTEKLSVIEEFEEISFQVLAEILAEHHHIELKYSREAIENTLDTIEELEKICGRTDKLFKALLFKERISNYVEYIIPVKEMKEVI